MKEVTIIGVDLAKNVFQVHGAAADGSVVFRKKLTRVPLCQGSCPLLYFSSISQVGGIGR